MSLAHPKSEYGSAVRGSGLWDEIEPYVRGLIEESHDIHGNLEVSESVRDGSNSAMSTFHQPLPPSPLEVTGDATNEYQPEVAATIQEDIEGIKERYIVGKTVGRDLCDSDGRLVAKHGESITHQLLRVVEEAGLLVELIEHMTFTSFED